MMRSMERNPSAALRMIITFQCPNGHRLRCADTLAGQEQKCPACGTLVRIPTNGPSGPLAARVTPATGASPSLERIDFLCPNGHRLHGAPTLAGKPGQCPSCAARFQIPTLEEILAVQTPDDSDSRIHLAEEPEPDNRSVIIPRTAAANDLDQPLDFEDDVEGWDTVAEEDPSHALSAGTPRDMAALPYDSAAHAAELHPLAKLVGELWGKRSIGASIELHLDGAHVLVPDRYAPHLSRRSHGVFAVREVGGAFTVTVIAWDAVRRVEVRGLRELPGGMLE